MALDMYRYEYRDVAEFRKNPWDGYMKPHRVAPHVWLVSGHYDYGDYLLDTGEGLILIDTPPTEHAYLLIDSIWKAGFDPSEIKYHLISHWHGDHDGCSRMIKELSGCKIFMSKQDWEMKLNPPPIVEKFHMKPVPEYEPDEFYDDDTPITLGRFTIRTKLTPGHTPGVTSFFFEDTDEKTGITYNVGMHGGLGIDAMRPGNRMAEDGINEEIRETFIKQCWEMALWDIDITLGSHQNQCGMGAAWEKCKDRNDYLPLVDKRVWPVMLLERRSRVMEFRAGIDDQAEPFHIVSGEDLKEKLAPDGAWNGGPSDQSLPVEYTGISETDDDAPKKKGFLAFLNS